MDKYAKQDLIYEEKIPSSMDNYVGIEIEFISESDQDEITSMLADVDLQYNCNLDGDGSIEATGPHDKSKEKKISKLRVAIEKLEAEREDLENRRNNCHPYGKKWTERNNQIETLTIKLYDLVEDLCNLENDYDCNYYGHELRILCPEKNLVTVMTKVKEVFKQCNAFVNDTCGLHVHLDMRQRKAEDCFKHLLKKQDEMFLMVDKKRHTSTYCKKASKFKDTDRYRAINTASLSKHNTIEIRLHEGTVNTNDIVKWCKYLVSVIDSKPFTKELGSYVKSKIAKNSAKAS